MTKEPAFIFTKHPNIMIVIPFKQVAYLGLDNESINISLTNGDGDVSIRLETLTNEADVTTQLASYFDRIIPTGDIDPGTYYDGWCSGENTKEWFKKNSH